MPRSHAIWVVLNGPAVIAAFTVKHELRSWLHKQTDRERLRIFRCPDGPREYGPNAWVDPVQVIDL